jgi:hypothetical protein
MAEQDDPSIERRNARLEELKTAALDWQKREKERLNKQVALGKRILQGRAGPDGLAKASVVSVGNLTVDQINDFLTG